LKGRHFTLFTDHKPLENLGKVHTKTLNRLQHMMNEYSFTIVYKPGSEMPADFLSRHAVSAVEEDYKELIKQQEADPYLKFLKEFLLNRTLPSDEKKHCLSISE
jgi:hypothetical protein